MCQLILSSVFLYLAGFPLHSSSPLSCIQRVVTAVWVLHVFLCSCSCVIHLLSVEHLCSPVSVLSDRHTLTPLRVLWDIYVCLSLTTHLSSGWIMFRRCLLMSAAQYSSSLCVCVCVHAWAKGFMRGNEICRLDWHLSAFSPCLLARSHFLSRHFIISAYFKVSLLVFECHNFSTLIFSLMEYQLLYERCSVPSYSELPSDYIGSCLFMEPL